MEKLDIRNAKLEFCVRGYHRFNFLENEGMITLLQTFVDIYSRRSGFDVRDVLYGRNTISTFAKKAAKVMKTLKGDLIESQEAESVAVTLDLWTAVKQQNQSYLDVHAFWINSLFKIKHQCLAILYCETERLLIVLRRLN